MDEALEDILKAIFDQDGWCSDFPRKWREMFSLQWYKRISKRRLGVLRKLYSGTFSRFANVLPGTLQRLP
jgi:hypothetical protein